MKPCFPSARRENRSAGGWSSFPGLIFTPFFIRFRETTNLILLHNELNQQFILPKHAVSSEAEVSELYALIQSHIAHGKFLPRESRFPVLLAETAQKPFATNGHE